LGIVIKQATTTAIYSYIGAVLGFITVWFVNRTLLTPEENGLINLLISISIITGSLSNLGTAGMITRMFPHFKTTDGKHHGFIFYPIVVSLIGFVVFVGLYFLFKDELIARNMEKSRMFADNLFYLIPLTFFWALFYVFDNFSRSIYKTVAGVVIKEVILRIIILVAAYFYAKRIISFDIFLLIYCASFCSIAVILGVYLYAKGEIQLRPTKGYIDKTLRKEMVNVAAFSVITGLSGLLISSLDKIIVNDVLGLEMAGVFAVATYFGSVIQIPARSIMRVSSSIIADSWRIGNLENIKNVYHKTCLNQFIIGILFLMGIWVNIDEIMSLLPPEYASGKYVILLMSVGYLFDMATGANGIIIATSKYFRYDTYFMFLLLLVTFATNMLFIPLYGIVGAALATCITYFVFNFLRYLFIWKKFDMQPYDIDFIKVIVIALVSFGCAYAVPPTNNPYITVLIKGSVVSLLFVSMIYRANISHDFTALVDKVLARVKINQ
jgi:O-antigen/teichoic acid export membrane protein